MSAKSSTQYKVITFKIILMGHFRISTSVGTFVYAPVTVSTGMFYLVKMDSEITLLVESGLEYIFWNEGNRFLTHKREDFANSVTKINFLPPGKIKKQLSTVIVLPKKR